jgi:hypothetical protein
MLGGFVFERVYGAAERARGVERYRLGVKRFT